VGPWNTRERCKVVVARSTDNRFFRYDTGSLRDGVAFRARAQRKSLAIMGQDRQGAVIQDFKRMKMYRRVWIKASGAPCMVRLGVQQEIDGAIAWSPAKPFNPKVDQYLDFVKSGRAIVVEFYSRDSGLWSVHGYKPEVVPLGEF